MTRRERRGNANSDFLSTLQQLKESREKGVRRTQQFASNADDDIFDYLEDDEYYAHVAKNRSSSKKFIVSDTDSHDYVDDGEELWVQENTKDESQKPTKKKAAQLTKKQENRISSLLLRPSSSTPKQSKPGQENIRKTVMSTDTLDSYLQDFESNPFENLASNFTPKPVFKPPTPKKKLDIEGEFPEPSTPIAANQIKRSPLASKLSYDETLESDAITPTSRRKNPFSAPNKIIIEEEEGDADFYTSEENKENREEPATKIKGEAEPQKIEEKALSEEDKLALFNEANDLMNDDSPMKIETPPKEYVIKPVSFTPKTPVAPIPNPFAQPPSPALEFKKQSDWFSISEAGNDSDNETEAEEGEKEEQGDLQVEEGEKTFYVLDASYEYTLPGTVLFFGKVFNEEKNKYSSCCLRVENFERNLFVLPRSYRATKTVKEIHLENGKKERIEEWEEDENEEIDLNDVLTEFNKIRKEHGIKEFKAKPVNKKYCFTLDNVPRGESEYIKIVYKDTKTTKPLPDKLVGETFSHVFGLNQNLMESAILKGRIMGPQWIKLKNYQIAKSKFSWCEEEIIINSIKDIDSLPNQGTPPPPPSLVTMSIKLTTILNHAKQANEIVLISCLLHKAVKPDTPTPHWEKSLESFTCIRKLDRIPWPMQFRQRIKAKINEKHKIEICDTESQLLSKFIQYLTVHDPDIIVGHNYIGFDLDVLLHRMKHHNTASWSRLGRLQRRHMPKLQSGAGGQRDSTWEERQISSGRLICDTYLTCKELISIKQDSYSLSSLAEKQLNITRYEIENDNLTEYFKEANNTFQPNKDSNLIDRNLEFLIKYNENDTFLQFSLLFKFQLIPLSKQLTNLAGYLWSKSLTGSRAERISFYLMHEFNNKNYILPDKPPSKFKNIQRPASTVAQKASNQDNEHGEEPSEDGPAPSKTKKNVSYTGGLVLPPKRGFYDEFILLLDFNSLYPSLILEYNICFTTFDPRMQYDKDNNLILLEVPEIINKQEKGILPGLIKQLVDRRRSVKNLLKTEKDPLKIEQLNIRQLALKLTANSIYGCLGFPQSRFYGVLLAELITKKGREALTNAKAITEGKLGHNVIYGDTDSIMVASGCSTLQKAREIAEIVKKEINKKYTKLEIDLDGIFKKILLLKKKKYAALTIVDDSGATKKEFKGLDLVRRDWCPLSKRIGKQILEFILSIDTAIEDVITNIHNYLKSQKEQLTSMKLEDFVITKSLSKVPELYSKSTPLPHVTVALALVQQGKSVRVGDFIPYVICAPIDDSQESVSYAHRAYHPDHVKKAAGLLEIDFNWYLENQILAPILRLVDPIEGTSAQQIAECLGIQDCKLASRYHYTRPADDDEFFSPTLLDDQERYKSAEPLQLQCNLCYTAFPFHSIIYEAMNEEKEKKEHVAGHICVNRHCKMPLDCTLVQNQLHLFIKKAIRKYYSAWYICDDPSCSHRTRNVLVKSNITKCTYPGCRGNMNPEYSSTDLYNQLRYLQMKFDRKKAKEKLASLEFLVTAYDSYYESLGRIVESYLNANSHNFVDCKELFSCFAKLSLSK